MGLWVNVGEPGLFMILIPVLRTTLDMTGLLINSKKSTLDIRVERAEISACRREQMSIELYQRSSASQKIRIWEVKKIGLANETSRQRTMAKSWRGPR